MRIEEQELARVVDAKPTLPEPPDEKAIHRVTAARCSHIAEEGVVLKSGLDHGMETVTRRIRVTNSGVVAYRQPATDTAPIAIDTATRVGLTGKNERPSLVVRIMRRPALIPS